MSLTPIPSAGDKVFWSASTIITNGTYSFDALTRGRFNWGYKISAEPRTGSNMPFFGTASFSGTMDIEGYATFDDYQTSDDIFKAMIDVDETLHTVLDVTFTLAMGDTETSQKKETWTVVGKPNDLEKDPETDRIVKFRMKVTLTAVPTCVNT